jgi:hypothetical protein
VRRAAADGGLRRLARSAVLDRVGLRGIIVCGTDQDIWSLLLLGDCSFQFPAQLSSASASASACGRHAGPTTQRFRVSFILNATLLSSSLSLCSQSKSFGVCWRPSARRIPAALEITSQALPHQALVVGALASALHASCCCTAGPVPTSQSLSLPPDWRPGTGARQDRLVGTAGGRCS